MRKIKNGFSTVELMVALGISTIVGVGLMVVMENLNKGSKHIEQKFAIHEIKYMVAKALRNKKHCMANFENDKVTTSSYPSYSSLFFGKATKPGDPTYSATIGATYKPINNKKILTTKVYGAGSSQFRVTKIELSNLQKFKKLDALDAGKKLITIHNAKVDLIITYLIGEGKQNTSTSEQIQKIVLPINLDENNLIQDCGYHTGIDDGLCDIFGGDLVKIGNTLECKSIVIKERSTSLPAITAKALDIMDNGVVSNGVNFIPARLIVGETSKCANGKSYCSTPNEYKAPVICKVNGLGTQDCVLIGKMSEAMAADSKKIVDYIESFVSSNDPTDKCYDIVKRIIEIQYKNSKGTIVGCECAQVAQERGSCKFTSLTASSCGGGVTLPGGNWAYVPPSGYSGCEGPSIQNVPYVDTNDNDDIIIGSDGYFRPPEAFEYRDCNHDTMIVNGKIVSRPDNDYINCDQPDHNAADYDQFDCSDVCKNNGSPIQCDFQSTVSAGPPENRPPVASTGNFTPCTVDDERKHDIFKQAEGDLYVGSHLEMAGYTVANPAGTTGNIEVFEHFSAKEYQHHSDEKLKTDIKNIGLKNSSKILNINGVGFSWKKNGEKSMGVIAQELEKYFPELVEENKNFKLKVIELDKLIAPLIDVIKSNERKIKIQKKRITSIKKRLYKIKNKSL